MKTFLKRKSARQLWLALALCGALWGLPAREAAAAVTCSGTMGNVNFGPLDLVSGGTPSVRWASAARRSCSELCVPSI